MRGGPAFRALFGFSLHWALWTILVRPLPALQAPPVDDAAAAATALAV